MDVRIPTESQLGFPGGGLSCNGYVGGGEIVMKGTIYGSVKLREVSITNSRTTCLNRASLRRGRSLNSLLPR